MLGQAAVGYDALSAVRRTNAVLTRAIGATQSRDPVTAIQGARRAVAAYPPSTALTREATHYYAPAKRAAFWPLVTEGGGLAGARSPASPPTPRRAGSSPPPGVGRPTRRCRTTPPAPRAWCSG